jgi:uncharacterized protein (TIGR03083 family)
MSTDQDRLSGYIQAWQESLDDVIALLRDLDDAAWSTPTDLPGWDVRSVAAHLAHLEAELSGESAPVDAALLTDTKALTASFTQAGVDARAQATRAQILDELTRAAAARREQLAADPPTDASAPAPLAPGGLGWSWEVLLRNRAVDVWMHGQDIRRAVGRPGALNDAGSATVVTVFAMSFPYAVGKRVAPPAGTTVVLDVTGVHPVHLAVAVDETGRAVPLTEDPAEPDVHLTTDTETFVVLGGGRRPVAELPVTVVGDAALGHAVLEAMAVTP